MRNFDLMENQPVLAKAKRPQLALLATPKLPKLKGRHVSVLSNIPEASLSGLMKKTKAVRYAKEELLAPETRTDTYLVVFYGKASVCGIESRNEVTFQIQEATESNGEIALLTNEIRRNSTVSLEKALFSVISESEFNAWLADNLDVSVTSLPLPLDKLDS